MVDASFPLFLCEGFDFSCFIFYDRAKVKSFSVVNPCFESVTEIQLRSVCYIICALLSLVDGRFL